MPRRRFILQAGLAAPALLSAATREAFAQDPRKVIRAVPIGDLRVLDPIWTTAYITRNHGYLVYDTLFALDASNTPQPQMVERYETSADGLAWTFTLRPGLMWHDGTAVRAADCVASIRRWAAKDGMGRVLAAHTEGIEARDARTFTLRLKRRLGFVLDALGKIDSNVPFMMPERLAATDPNTQITEVVGSGPFRMLKDQWVPGAKVVYEKFADYVPRSEPPSQAAGGKVAKVDRVELLYLPDSATAMSGLQAGELDLLESPAPDLVDALSRSRGITVAPNDPLGYQLFAVLNQIHPPFDKPEARRALMAAIKQSDFMEATAGERTPWRKCASVFGCTAADGDLEQELGWPQYDPAKARALLREAGYDGRPLVILDPADNATLHPPALVIADALRRIGATVDVQTMDWSGLVQRRANRAVPSQGGWNLSSPTQR